MAAYPHPRLIPAFKSFSNLASVVVLGVGVLVLGGWIFDIPLLRSGSISLATMQGNTAIAFILAGLSLLLRNQEQAPRFSRYVMSASSLIVILLSLLTLSQYIFSRDFGIDQLVIKDDLTLENAYPGRMAPATAANFCLLGLALLTLDFRPYRWLVEICSITALIISVAALMGYAYGVQSLYRFFSFSSIAIHTAVTFSILSIGILFAHPDRGLMKIFSSDNLGGVMVRRLVPGAIVLPIALGWLLLSGQRMGLYDSTFGLVLYALSMLITFTLLIWWNASLLQKAEIVRQQALAQLSESKEREAAILYTSLDAVITIDSKGRVLEFNPAAQEIFGYDRTDVLGREMSELILPPGLREKHREGLARYLATGQATVLGKRIELTGMRADGTEFPVELTITRITALEPPIFTGFVRDITHRIQAQEQIAYQAYLLESVNDAVIGSDENTLIRFWNKGAETMFGWKSEEVVGHTGREILRSEILHTDRQTVFEILAETGRWKGESIQYRKDGTPVPMEVSTITLRDSNGQITGYVSVCRDIADRKLAEKESQKIASRTQALADISRALAAVRLDDQAVLDATAKYTAELMGDACAIRLVSVDEQWLELVSLYHPEPKTLESLRDLSMATPLRTDVGLGAQVIDTRQPVLIPVVSSGQLKDILPATDSAKAAHISIHSFLIVPLRTQGIVLGTLTLLRDRPDSPHTLEDQSFVQDLADRAALSIVNARLYTAVQQLNDKLEQRVVERTAALSQANSLLQMMLDHMPDQIYFKDTKSRFIRNSKSQATALGLNDPSEAVGKSDFDFFPHAQQSYETEQEIMRSGTPLVDVEERVVWPTGQETWVSTTKVPLRDQSGQIIGTFGISRDITERKQSEAALQKAKLELEAANKELEAFSYSVSHDLRAPLRSIDGYSQAVLEDYGELLPMEGRNFLEHIRSSTHRMAELIDDLLDLSRVTRTLLKFVPVDLTRLAGNIRRELQQTEPERNVTWRVAPNLHARGDPNLLQIVLENLLNNAWKYSSKQEQAEIEFGSKSENNETVFFVRDNGAGFDMAYANKLFGAFQRLHGATEFPGTGIGLATVQRIIRRHGGRVWAESTVGKGATFFFTLPSLEDVQLKTKAREEDSGDPIVRRAKQII